jgi:hypothetical protein
MTRRAKAGWMPLAVYAKRGFLRVDEQGNINLPEWIFQHRLRSGAIQVRGHYSESHVVEPVPPTWGCWPLFDSNRLEIMGPGPSGTWFYQVEIKC